MALDTRAKCRPSKIREKFTLDWADAAKSVGFRRKKSQISANEIDKNFVVGKSRHLSFSQIVVVFGKCLIQVKIFTVDAYPTQGQIHFPRQASFVTLPQLEGFAHRNRHGYGRCGHRANERVSRGRAAWDFSLPVRCPYRSKSENNRHCKLARPIFGPGFLSWGLSTSGHLVHFFLFLISFSHFFPKADNAQSRGIMPHMHGKILSKESGKCVFNRGCDKTQETGNGLRAVPFY